MSTGALVLGGGRSRRMGVDKASLPFGDETLLARVVRIVSSVVDEVRVVAREGQDLPGPFDVVRDPAEGLGPLAGLVAGLEALPCDRVFLCSCDLPALRPALIARLFELASGYDAAVPEIDGHAMVTCAVYSSRVLPTARRLLEQRRLRPLYVIEACNARIVSADELRDVDPDLESLRDCDTPNAYREALARAGLPPPPTELLAPYSV